MSSFSPRTGQADVLLVDLAWQIVYYYAIIVARRQQIEKEGRMTSFTYMLHNKRSLIGKTLNKIPPAKREVSFMAGQFAYTIITMAPSVIILYDSLPASVIWLVAFFRWVAVFTMAAPGTDAVVRCQRIGVEWSVVLL